MAGRGLTELINVNGTAFFAIDDGITGIELWKSDGTEAGTVLVKDINPSGGSSPSEFTDVNGILFFSADNGVTGNELWKSDGTEAGWSSAMIMPPITANYRRFLIINTCLTE